MNHPLSVSDTPDSPDSLIFSPQIANLAPFLIIATSFWSRAAAWSFSLVPKLLLGTPLSGKLCFLRIGETCRMNRQAYRAAKLRGQRTFPSATWERGELILRQAGMTELFHNTCGKIRVQRIDRDSPFRRNDNQVHIFHRHRTEQHLIAEHNRTDVAFPVFKLNVNGPHIRAELSPAISDGHFLLRAFLKLELICNVFGNTQKHRPAIGEGFYLDRSQRWQSRIIEEDFCGSQTHD